MVVQGRVQGVGFRFAIARAARSRRVAGWVRNRSDGTVEAVFEGEPDAVESLVRLCSEGPRGAEVQQAHEAEEDAQGLAGFDIR